MLNKNSSKKFNLEFKLLVHFCQLAITEKGNLVKLSNVNSINWDKLLKLSARHRVSALLYFGICKSPLKEKIPTEIFEQLKAITFQRTAKNFNQTKELLQLIDLYKLKGIKAIPYKGIVLAQDAYENLASREFSDIDLLINLKDLDSISEIMTGLNYQPESSPPDFYWSRYKKNNCEFNFDFHENGKRIFHIEPHWTIGKKLQQLQLTLKDFQPFLVEENFLTQKIEKLSPTGLLITTCIHHISKEEWFSLKHVCDIAAILNKFQDKINWNEVFTFCKKHDLEKMLLVGLVVAKETFELKLPVEVTDKFHDQSKIDALVERKLEELKKEKLDARSSQSIFQNMFFYLSLRDNWFTKLKIYYYHFLQIIKPNMGDFDKKNIGLLEYYLLYLKKPFRLWKTYIKN